MKYDKVLSYHRKKREDVPTQDTRLNPLFTNERLHELLSQDKFKWIVKGKLAASNQYFIFPDSQSVIPLSFVIGYAVTEKGIEITAATGVHAVEIGRIGLERYLSKIERILVAAPEVSGRYMNIAEVAQEFHQKLMDTYGIDSPALISQIPKGSIEGLLREDYLTGWHDVSKQGRAWGGVFGLALPQNSIQSIVTFGRSHYHYAVYPDMVIRTDIPRNAEVDWDANALSAPSMKSVIFTPANDRAQQCWPPPALFMFEDTESISSVFDAQVACEESTCDIVFIDRYLLDDYILATWGHRRPGTGCTSG